MLLIIRAVTRRSGAHQKLPVQGSWLSRMLAKKPRMLVAIALANKMICTMLTKQKVIETQLWAMAA